MNDKRKRTILSVMGMVALLIVCVIGVQAVFAGLGMVSAQHGGVSSSIHHLSGIRSLIFFGRL